MCIRDRYKASYQLRTRVGEVDQLQKPQVTEIVEVKSTLIDVNVKLYEDKKGGGEINSGFELLCQQIFPIISHASPVPSGQSQG